VWHDSNDVETPDGINSDPTVRKVWVSIAQKCGVDARAFNFIAPVDLCLHNDSVRALGGPQVCSFKLLIV
jgi:bifunctional polynucleotide phosphatase/kinase